MNRRIACSVAVLVTLAFATQGSAQNASFERRAPRVTRGAALSLPSTASPRAIAARYLSGRGHDEATVNSLTLVAESTGRGVRHARFEQRVSGLPVFGAYAKTAMNARGQLVSVIETLAPVRGAVEPAQVSEAEAIRSAIRNLYPNVLESAPRFFHRPPSATAVAIPNADGSMRAGYLVETWTENRNHLNYTLVDGTGRIADVELRTNTDQYRIFPVHPGVTPQTTVTGPGPGNAESPAGWLFPSGQTTRNIAGNNARAYLDAASDNVPDSGGVAAGEDFLAEASLDTQPTDPNNRDVAVQNLFYLNNLLHDELYKHGFTEATGNFQETNFGPGGLGSDSVNAEAQDGGGTDNANFATPTDGSNPRMQMYLWNGLGTHRVEIGSLSFLAQGAEWGPALNTTGIDAPLALVNDGAGTITDACERLPRGSLTGKIAIADRGNCDFTVKATNVQTAGARAIIVANNVDGPIFTMGGAGSRITIPGVMVNKTDGSTMKGLAGNTATVKLALTPPLSLDGDVDSDIVYHEYGHGLTWRMIGGMSGPMAGAIGEGMSDVLAIILNNDDRVGEYSTGDTNNGIRRQRYAGYAGSYASMTGAQVHDDGEVYGAIGWRLFKNFEAAGVSKDVVLDYLVDGMNFTPSTPDVEAMRDGILQAIATESQDAGVDPAPHQCLVWEAFSHYGVGPAANGVVKGKGLAVSEDFTLPAGCPSVP